jgi:hypothetical protein
VKFKIHENLPSEAAETLRQSGFAADTVADEDLSGSNDETVARQEPIGGSDPADAGSRFCKHSLVPAGEHSGIIVLRLKRQDKQTVLSYIRRLATALAKRSPHGELWIVDGNRIRFRKGN